MKISVTVKTRSSKSSIQKISDSSYLAYLFGNPVENEANLELIKLFSKYFDVSKSRIFIKSGLKSKRKIMEIENV